LLPRGTRGLPYHPHAERGPHQRNLARTRRGGAHAPQKSSSISAAAVEHEGERMLLPCDAPAVERLRPDEIQDLDRPPHLLRARGAKEGIDEPEDEPFALLGRQAEAAKIVDAQIREAIKRIATPVPARRRRQAGELRVQLLLEREDRSALAGVVTIGQQAIR